MNLVSFDWSGCGRGALPDPGKTGRIPARWTDAARRAASAPQLCLCSRACRFATWAASRATLPPEAVMPVVTTLFLAFAASFGVIAWRRGRWTRATSPMRTLPAPSRSSASAPPRRSTPSRWSGSLVQAARSPEADMISNPRFRKRHATLDDHYPGRAPLAAARCDVGLETQRSGPMNMQTSARAYRFRPPQIPTRPARIAGRNGGGEPAAPMRRAVSTAPKRNGGSSNTARTSSRARPRRRGGSAARAVREFPRHHPAGRDRHLGDRMAAAGPARERAPLRGDRHHGDRRPQCAARLSSRRRAPNARCAP